jgi:hypothetical protein
MTRVSFAEELESAADRIADISRADLQIILRRAALMLRNVAGVPLEPATGDTLDSIAAEMGIGRSDLMQIVLREWLKSTLTCRCAKSTKIAKRTAALRAIEVARRPRQSRKIRINSSRAKGCFTP